MTKKRIAILGGGAGGLTTAWELTKTAELRDLHDVTVYQMGWRLGGKLASGRAEPHARNVEHGLHIWFGFYENVFRMFQDIYEEWTPPDGYPFPTWESAVKARNYTPVGYEKTDGTFDYYPMMWPTNGDTPGDGKVALDLWGVVTELLSLIKDELVHPRSRGSEVRKTWLPGWVARLADRVFAPGDRSHREADEGHEPARSRILDTIRGWFRAAFHVIFRHHVFLWLLSVFLRIVRPVVQAKLNRLIDEDRHASNKWELIDIVVTLIVGLLDPRNGVVESMDLNVLNHFEYSDWLIANGASEKAVRRSVYTRLIYESFFAYRGGDVKSPEMEAGTAIRIVIRILAMYKGAAAWEVQGGMGDVFIAPLYQLLRDRGVRFEFFHRTERLELSEDRKRIERIHLGRQAELAGERYDPLVAAGGMPSWTLEPRWSQLVDGARLEREKINFESNWCPEPTTPVVLERGTHFDTVVLAMSLGAFKPLNDEPTPCQELIDHDPRWREMVEKLGLIPSQAVQVWLKKGMDELGFDYKRERVESMRPAMVCGPDPLDIWADMSQVLAVEDWSGVSNRPKSVFYLCGVWATDLYKRPKTDTRVPSLARDAIVASTVQWFDEHTRSVWPNVARAGSTGLDWNELYDSENRAGIDRLGFQYIRPNVDPTECCVASLVDTTRCRIRADDTGFDNLVVAGAWIRTGLNATCVEAAVMSGMAASQAICGSPAHIVGWDFLQRW